MHERGHEARNKGEQQQLDRKKVIASTDAVVIAFAMQTPKNKLRPYQQVHG
jgi:hypothetical protein